MKNLYHPWNLSIAQKVLYSGKGFFILRKKVFGFESPYVTFVFKSVRLLYSTSFVLHGQTLTSNIRYRRQELSTPVLLPGPCASASRLMCLHVIRDGATVAELAAHRPHSSQHHTRLWLELTKPLKEHHQRRKTTDRKGRMRRKTTDRKGRMRRKTTDRKGRK